ncbi:MAG TPA: hypothetical protein VFL59_06545 [Candidatus Nanopelagicales bacterium]|nr:hypothetical protein [Candidatus Nanopelagicales bacterium]
MSTDSTDDVEALKARIATLEAKEADLESKRRFSGRGVTAWVLVVVAALLFPIAITAFWAQKTLLDTQRYVETVAPLATDPTIRDAVSTQVSTAINNQIDSSGKVDEILADFPKLQPLAGPITAGLHNLVNTTVDKVVTSDQFAGLWTQVNAAVQQGVVKVLSSDGQAGPITIQGDQVVLDTGDLINAVKQRLVDRGFTWAQNLPVPAAADRQIVLLTSPQLAQARVAYQIAQPVSQWLIFLVLLLFVAAILVAVRRARMVIAVGVAIILGALVVRLMLAYGSMQLELNLSGTTWAVAQNAFVTILTQYLIVALRASFVLGLVMAVVGWYLSDTTSAQASRAYLTKVTSGAGASAGDTALGRVGGWFARTRTFWRFAIPALAVLVLVFQTPLTGATILWVTLVAVIAFVVLEILVAAGRANAEAAAAAEAPESVDA